MARTPAGLSDEQVAALRAALLSNKRPKVTVAGQQFGGETTGQVVSVGDAETEGAEFVQVRVTLDGLTDVLRFAPKELRLPQRGRAAGERKAPGVRAPRRAATPKAAASTPGGGAAVALSPAAAPKQAVVAQPAPVPQRVGVSTPVAAPTSATAAKSATAAQPVAQPVPAAKPAPRSRKLVVRPPMVTITLSSSGTDWSVTANRGGRSVLKAASIAPGVVAAAVELLGEQSISTAVEEVNGAALSLAQQRADELRIELAAVESLLAAHRAPGR